MLAIDGHGGSFAQLSAPKYHRSRCLRGHVRCGARHQRIALANARSWWTARFRRSTSRRDVGKPVATIVREGKTPRARTPARASRHSKRTAALAEGHCLGARRQSFVRVEAMKAESSRSSSRSGDADRRASSVQTRRTRASTAICVQRALPRRADQMSRIVRPLLQAVRPGQHAAAIVARIDGDAQGLEVRRRHFG